MPRRLIAASLILLCFVNLSAARQRAAFTVGTAAAAPGQKVTGTIEVPAASDPALSIPVAVIRGAKPGPALALVSGAHGTEYASIIALEKMIEVWRAENPSVGFTSIVLGDTMTDFGNGWDPPTIETFLKEWMARGQLYARQMAPESVAAQVVHALAAAERVDQIVVLPREP